MQASSDGRIRATPLLPAGEWRWAAIWREERGGGWRALVTLALCAGGTLAGLLIFTAIQLGGLKEALADAPACAQSLAPLAGTILVAGMGLAGCLAGVRFVHRKPVACVFTDGRPFGWGLALRSAGLWALLWLGFTLPLPGAWTGVMRRIGEVPAAWWPTLFAASVGAMAVGRTAEEVLFRGYLQPRIAAWVRRPWLAVLLVAGVFNFLHGGNAAAHTAITLLALAWGAGGVRAGTLAPMIGAHVAHDTMNVLLLPPTHVTTANAATTWPEVGLVAAGVALWFSWLWWSTASGRRERQEPGGGFRARAA